MPYGRRRYAPKRRRTTYRKRTLSRKNIRRRTSAKSQSRQIAQLTRQVSKINRQQYERFSTEWQRDNLSVESFTTAGFPYVCPVPYMPMDPNDTYNPGSGITTRWKDNLAIATQPYYTKSIVFGCSQAAFNTPLLEHTGGKIKWQMTSTEPSMSKITLALISLKHSIADQKTVDNNLLGDSSVPYGPPVSPQECIIDDVDYHVHSGAGATGAATTSFGTTFNRKYWNVHYQREITFGHPGATNVAQNVNPANSTPANNSLVATGSIKIPAAGLIRSVSLPNDPVRISQNAMELGLIDQSNEKCKYLVAISNGVSADQEQIFLGFVATDYYKAVV